MSGLSAEELAEIRSLYANAQPSGSNLHVQALLDTITERDQEIERLREALGRFRDVWRGTPVGSVSEAAEELCAVLEARDGAEGSPGESQMNESQRPLTAREIAIGQELWRKRQAKIDAGFCPTCDQAFTGPPGLVWMRHVLPSGDALGPRVREPCPNHNPEQKPTIDRFGKALNP
jgi:hypothetical protein